MRALLTTWVVTRVIMVALVSLRSLPQSLWFPCASDIFAYQRWARMIEHTGMFPIHDDNWQYPPAAAAIMLVPQLLPVLGYWWWFFVWALATDAGALWLLVRLGRGRLAGAWVWTVGVVCLGRICFGRFDLFVSVAAIAVLAVAVRRPMVAGVITGIGALVKLWPLALLIGLPRGRPLVRVCTGAVLVMGATAVVLGWAVPGAWSFLRFQSERGVQIESVVATPLLVWRLIAPSASGESITHRYGAEELVGPMVGTASTLCLVATVAGLVVLAAWWLRRRWTPAVVPDAALFAVLLAMATSRVLSPQYFLWPIGIAAVCAITRGTSQRPIIVMVVAMAAATQLEYPFLYQRVAEGTIPGVSVLALRNCLLAWTTVRSGLRLWHSRQEGTASPSGADELVRVHANREFDTV